MPHYYHLVSFCVLRNLTKVLSVPLRYCSTAIPIRRIKQKPLTDRTFNFIDWRNVKVFGGKGGNGAISFMQLWCNPNAGPDGGDGGNGGHIIFEADSSIKSLQKIGSLYFGKAGENGRHKDMHGANAEHTIIKVPVGTVFKREDKIVADLDQHEKKYIAARGGAGGKGNHFYLTNENRHPQVAELGAIGEEHSYELELKILAHAGLIGFPNAGKSTLLRAISRAHPKVASYPFTTLKPHIGIIHYDDYVQLAVADLPGLITGAHKNVGLGFSFLRHVERCICLFYVIDLAAKEPWEQFRSLQYELEQYKDGLSTRPFAIVANKIDLPEAEANLSLLREKVDIPVVPISAKKGKNVSQLVYYLREMYEKHGKGKLEW